jgi:hypothetical protein
MGTACALGIPPPTVTHPFSSKRASSSYNGLLREAITVILLFLLFQGLSGYLNFKG